MHIDSVVIFLAGVFATIWYQIGLYGFYLGMYNTESHAERWNYIVKDMLDAGPMRTFRFFIIWASVALAGPVIYMIAKISYAGYLRRMKSEEV